MFSMPQLIKDTDFGLADTMSNLLLLEEVETHEPVVLCEEERYVILEQGQGEHRIAMKDKRDGRMVYVVEFETQYSPIGKAVTQVTVWRDPDSSIVQGKTRKIFDEVLLPRFGIIMSDREQTRAAEQFWRGRMADAVERGDRVGLAFMAAGDIDWYDPKVCSFKSWITSKDGWGTADSYQDRRFIISRVGG